MKESEDMVAKIFERTNKYFENEQEIMDQVFKRQNPEG